MVMAEWQKRWLLALTVVLVFGSLLGAASMRQVRPSLPHRHTHRRLVAGGGGYGRQEVW